MPTTPPFRSELLRVEHDVDRFTSGNDELDRWLRTSARHADAAGTSRVYVWLSNADEVVAYYALAPHEVRKHQAPKRVGRRAPERIPAILLARLALAEHLQGKGNGGALLADAVGTALMAIRIAGGRLIVVDAIDDRAASFYANNGFTPSDEDERRLLIEAGDAAKPLAIEWP